MSEIQTKKLLIFHQFGFQSHFCSECVKCKIFVWISDTFVKCLISGHFFEMPDIRTLFWNAWYPDTFLKCLISGHFCLFSCVLNETYKSLDFRHLLIIFLFGCWNMTWAFYFSDFWMNHTSERWEYSRPTGESWTCWPKPSWTTRRWTLKTSGGSLEKSIVVPLCTQVFCSKTRFLYILFSLFSKTGKTVSIYERQAAA